MSFDRLSVTVPAELGSAIRELARRRGASVSQVVTEALEHQVRHTALALALEEADERFGAVPEAEIEAVMREIQGLPIRPRRRSSG